MKHNLWKEIGKIKYKVLCVPLGVLGMILLYLTWNMGYTLRYSGKVPISDRIRMILNLDFFPAVFLSVGCYLILLVIFNYGSKILKYGYKYRYIIAVVLFLCGIIMELSGSSISMYGEYLGLDLDSRGLLFGVGRGIRMDEWATNTPMALSQYANQFGYFTDIIRGTSTDAFIVYGQPVADIAVIFRPFHWGYLFLSPARGLSFFWCGRLLALFLVSFEMGMLITKRNKFWSLLYSLLLSFSPLVQWWFAINGLVEMLVFGQLFLLMVRMFLVYEKWIIKIVCALVAAICAGGYVLVFYPAWQVPLGYIFLGLFIWVLFEYGRKWHFQFKKDVSSIVLFLFVFAGGLAYIFLKSQDTILSVLNTAYPGARLELGGGCALQPLQYGGNLLFSLISDNLPGILCELTEFFDFSPLGVCLALWVILKEKNRDKLLIIQLFICLFLWIYVAIPIPEFLARITFLSFSQAGRTAQVIGFANLLLLIRSVALLKNTIGRLQASVATFVLTSVLLVVNHKIYGDYLPVLMLAAVGCVLAVSFYLILRSQKTYAKMLLGIVICGLLFYSGGLTNPVQKGLDVVYQTDLMQEIQQITKTNPKGKWICDMVGYPMNNYCIMGGAPTIDSINVYPDLERWNVLDPDKEQEEIYNRYAHIDVEITDDNTNFQAGSMADSFKILLNKNDLGKLDVSYILTNRALEGFTSEEAEFHLITEGNGYKIYRYVEERENTNG